MAISKVSLDILEKTIKKLLHIKRNKFWSYDFLPSTQKRQFEREIMVFVLLQFTFWLFALILTIISLAPNIIIYPQFVFDFLRPIMPKFFFKIGFSIFMACGYFLGNATECYYAYVVLHNYFQMKTLMAFINEALGRYKKISFNRKMFDSEYQLAVEEVLRRAIQQFHQLKLLIEIVNKTFFHVNSI